MKESVSMSQIQVEKEANGSSQPSSKGNFSIYHFSAIQAGCYDCATRQPNFRPVKAVAGPSSMDNRTHTTKNKLNDVLISAPISGASEPRLNGTALRNADAPRRSRRQYRSEYRVRYRPFSQYEYVDGRFVPSPGASSPTVENVKPLAKDVPVPKHTDMTDSIKSGDPWYKEVVELRKQANDYKVLNFNSCHSNKYYTGYCINIVPWLGNRPGPSPH